MIRLISLGIHTQGMKADHSAYKLSGPNGFSRLILITYVNPYAVVVIQLDDMMQLFMDARQKRKIHIRRIDIFGKFKS
jgi:hypothetical protein